MNDEYVAYIDIDLEDLIPDFLDNRRKDVVQIGQLLCDGNLQEIRRLGHSMKGSGGGYGFDEVGEIGGKIEAAALAGDTTVIEKQVEALSEYVANVKIVWQEEE